MAVVEETRDRDFVARHHLDLLLVCIRTLGKLTTTTERTAESLVFLCVNGLVPVLPFAKDNPQIVERIRERWDDIFRPMRWLWKTLFRRSPGGRSARFLVFFGEVVKFFENITEDPVFRPCLFDVILTETTMSFMADVWRTEYSSRLPPHEAGRAEEYASRLLTCGYSPKYNGLNDISNGDLNDVLRTRRTYILKGRQTAAWVVRRFRLRLEKFLSDQQSDLRSLFIQLAAFHRILLVCTSEIPEVLGGSHMVSSLCRATRKLLRDNRLAVASYCQIILAIAIKHGGPRTMRLALSWDVLEMLVVYGVQCNLQYDVGGPGAGVINTDRLTAQAIIPSLLNYVAMPSSISLVDKALQRANMALGGRSLYPKLREQWNRLHGILAIRLNLMKMRVCENVSLFLKE